jgi:hypothetical protein
VVDSDPAAASVTFVPTAGSSVIDKLECSGCVKYSAASTAIGVMLDGRSRPMVRDADMPSRRSMGV